MIEEIRDDVNSFVGDKTEKNWFLKLEFKK